MEERSDHTSIACTKFYQSKLICRKFFTCLKKALFWADDMTKITKQWKYYKAMQRFAANVLVDLHVGYIVSRGSVGGSRAVPRGSTRFHMCLGIQNTSHLRGSVVTSFPILKGEFRIKRCSEVGSTQMRQTGF